MKNFVPFEPLQVEIGLSMVPFFNGEKESISDDVQFLRHQFAERFGFILPSIRVVDNPLLTPSSSYEIKINELSVAKETVHIDHFLAIQTPYTLDSIEGIHTSIQFLTNDAFWIKENQQQEAIDKKYEVMSPKTIFMTHLTHVLEHHMHELVTRQSIADLLEETEQHSPAIVFELEQANISMSVIQHVITSLLKERISIRNIPFILEMILTSHDSASDTDELLYQVRKALIPTLLEQAKHQEGVWHYVDVEHQLSGEDFLSFVTETLSCAEALGVQPIFLLNDGETQSNLFNFLHQRQIYAIVVERSHLPFNAPLQKIEIFAK